MGGKTAIKTLSISKDGDAYVVPTCVYTGSSYKAHFLANKAEGDTQLGTFASEKFGWFNGDVDECPITTI